MRTPKWAHLAVVSTTALVASLAACATPLEPADYVVCDDTKTADCGDTVPVVVDTNS